MTNIESITEWGFSDFQNTFISIQIPECVGNRTNPSDPFVLVEGQETRIKVLVCCKTKDLNVFKKNWKKYGRYVSMISNICVPENIHDENEISKDLESKQSSENLQDLIIPTDFEFVSQGTNGIQLAFPHDNSHSINAEKFSIVAVYEFMSIMQSEKLLGQFHPSEMNPRNLILNISISLSVFADLPQITASSKMKAENNSPKSEISIFKASKSSPIVPSNRIISRKIQIIRPLFVTSKIVDTISAQFVNFQFENKSDYYNIWLKSVDLLHQTNHMNEYSGISWVNSTLLGSSTVLQPGCCLNLVGRVEKVLPRTFGSETASKKKDKNDNSKNRKKEKEKQKMEVPFIIEWGLGSPVLFRTNHRVKWASPLAQSDLTVSVSIQGPKSCTVYQPFSITVIVRNHSTKTKQFSINIPLIFGYDHANNNNNENVNNEQQKIEEGGKYSVAVDPLAVPLEAQMSVGFVSGEDFCSKVIHIIPIRVGTLLFDDLNVIDDETGKSYSPINPLHVVCFGSEISSPYSHSEFSLLV